MSPTFDVLKEKAFRNLFSSKPDSEFIHSEYERIIKNNKKQFIDRWNFDPEKFTKLNMINKSVMCSANCIGNIKQEDFLVVKSFLSSCNRIISCYNFCFIYSNIPYKQFLLITMVQLYFFLQFFS